MLHVRVCQYLWSTKRFTLEVGANAGAVPRGFLSVSVINKKHVTVPNLLACRHHHMKRSSIKMVLSAVVHFVRAAMRVIQLLQ